MILIRKILTLTEQKLARDIFDKTWAGTSGTEITPNLLQAMVNSGSYLSGAFIDHKIVGAAFAFPATNGGLHLHSHMTAVLPEFRDKGVGYALKIDQWNWAKKKNYSHLSWTFDPLVRRNAKLNIAKLGVDISGYFPNFYGDMPDALNAGDESDRLMVSWRTDIDAPRARELITNPELGDILIEIPEDIVAIRSKDQSESMKWRRQVREKFMAAFEKNGKVIGFSENNEYVVRI
ncbi:acetyltransferase [Candidatus Nanopelagicus hibericus]|uniref:Acetyltransferase n=1 Tax=Candidatus Nanopelagicus hibericus TaxID=1884915 RepID=A0A249KAK6_9ACTN|nr:GNAT family N-acetyltransferase [Candidatus Nanopelagicus hibericus]ASY13840.1 acetyltransferase [Candidatus Nanopelagicus hibericus]